MTDLAAALRARGLPVEVVGLGGLLDEPEVRDLVSALRVLIDPLAGAAAARLLTGARWRLGAADLAALWKRAAELGQAYQPEGEGRLVDTVPGEGAEQAGLVDAIDDPGAADQYSHEGYRRIRTLGGELRMLRRRLDQPLPELVADVERAMLLDIEATARVGGARRAHLQQVRRRGLRLRAGEPVGQPVRAAGLPGRRGERGGRPRTGRGRGRGGPRADPHRAQRQGPRVGDRRRAAPGDRRLSQPQADIVLAARGDRAARRAARRLGRPARARPFRGHEPEGGRGRADRPRRGVRRARPRRGAAALLRGADPVRAHAAGVRALVGQNGFAAQGPVGLLHRGRHHGVHNGRTGRLGRALGAAAGRGRGEPPCHRGAHRAVAGRPALARPR